MGGFYPYIRDIFRRKTEPHVYTWLIWAITQGTATAALLYGGGGYAGMSLIVGTVLVTLVFLLSFKFGTKNITKSDTLLLTAALLAVIVWWRLNNPYLAVSMIILIDGIGYVPTLRKSYQEPWSETLSYWVLMTATSIMTLISNNSYNFLTTGYLSMLAVANISVWAICFSRRKVVER